MGKVRIGPTELPEVLPMGADQKSRLASIQKLLKEAFLSEKPFDLGRSRG